MDNLGWYGWISCSCGDILDGDDDGAIDGYVIELIGEIWQFGVGFVIRVLWVMIKWLNFFMKFFMLKENYERIRILKWFILKIH